MNIDFKISRRRRRRVAHDEGETLALFHGVAFKGNSSTQSNPVTTNQVTDQRVAASEGSVSAGSGATVSIQSVDADVVGRSVDAVSAIAANANDAMSETTQAAVNATQKAASDSVNASADAARAAAQASTAAVQENADVSKVAIGAVQQQGRDALDFGDNIVGRVLDNAAKAQQSTNDLIQHTNEQFTAKLASNAGDAPQSTVDNVVKYISIAAGIIGIVAVFRSNNK